MRSRPSHPRTVSIDNFDFHNSSERFAFDYSASTIIVYCISWIQIEVKQMKIRLRCELESVNVSKEVGRNEGSMKVAPWFEHPIDN